MNARFKCFHEILNKMKKNLLLNFLLLLLTEYFGQSVPPISVESVPLISDQSVPLISVESVPLQSMI